MSWIEFQKKEKEKFRNPITKRRYIIQKSHKIFSKIKFIEHKKFRYKAIEMKIAKTVFAVFMNNRDQVNSRVNQT